MQSFSVQSRSSFPQEFARLACTLHFGRQPHICCAISPTRRLADLLLLYICYGIARVFSIGSALGSPRPRGGFKPETIVCQRKAINFNCIRCHCPLVQPSRLTAYSFSLSTFASLHQFFEETANWRDFMAKLRSNVASSLCKAITFRQLVWHHHKS